MSRTFLGDWPRKYWPREVWVHQSAIDLAEKIDTMEFSDMPKVHKTLAKVLSKTRKDAVKKLQACFCCNLLRPAKIKAKEWVQCPYCSE